MRAAACHQSDVLPERAVIAGRARVVWSWLVELGREYPYFVAPFALVLALAFALLLLTQGASYVAPFFYAIF